MLTWNWSSLHLHFHYLNSLYKIIFSAAFQITSDYKSGEYILFSMIRCVLYLSRISNFQPSGATNTVRSWIIQAHRTISGKKVFSSTYILQMSFIEWLQYKVDLSFDSFHNKGALLFALLTIAMTISLLCISNDPLNKTCEVGRVYNCCLHWHHQ